MKNLATCKPSEFLVQTNRIRKAIDRWFTDTDILNIRKRMPHIEENATKEEKGEALKVQARKNWNAMLDAMLEEHPDETLEVLALCSFVEPEDVDSYTVSEYLKSFMELIQNEAVRDFFTLLMQLVQ